MQGESAEFFHLHIPGVTSERGVPICIGVEAAQIEEDLFTVLRTLQELHPGFDELLLLAHRDRVLAGYQLDNPESLRQLLVECPPMLLLPEVARSVADLLDQRNGEPFVEIGKELKRRRKSSPRQEARQLRDGADALTYRSTAKPSSKEVIGELEPEALLERGAMEQVRKAIKSGQMAPQARLWRLECREHHERGVFRTQHPGGAEVIGVKGREVWLSRK